MVNANLSDFDIKNKMVVFLHRAKRVWWNLIFKCIFHFAGFACLIKCCIFLFFLFKLSPDVDIA